MFLTIQTLLATLGLHWLIRTTMLPVRRISQACSRRREDRLRKRIHKLEAKLAATAAKNQIAPTTQAHATPIRRITGTARAGIRRLIPTLGRNRKKTEPAASTPNSGELPALKAGAGFF